MCQVVAYRRFKTVENSQTVSRKSGHGGFQYKALLRIFLMFSSFSIVVTYIRCENTWKTSAQLQ